MTAEAPAAPGTALAVRVQVRHTPLLRWSRRTFNPFATCTCLKVDDGYRPLTDPEHSVRSGGFWSAWYAHRDAAAKWEVAEGFATAVKAAQKAGAK